MDIVFARVFHFLMGLFFPLFIGFVATVFVSAILINRGVLNRSRQMAVARIVVGILVPFLLACICSVFLETRFANARLKSLAAVGTELLIIQDGSKRIEIRDPAAIKEFFSVVSSGRGVWGHASHPVDKIKLLLPGIGYSYSLGRDSQVKDEFWLDWLGYPGSDRDHDIGNIRQFRSSRLSDWLKNHVESAEPDRAANGSQPFGSETSRTSSAAGSRQ